MRRFPLAATIILLAPAMSQAATALRWGALGHRVIADIALDRLSPGVAAETRRLLAGRSLADVSTWADSQRTALPNTGPWHYVDILVTDSSYVPARDCKEGACVVDALTNQLALLADRTRPDSVRAVALKWVVHLVGDLHQPLHAGERGDRGGNDIKITFAGRQSNLHSLWDSGLLTSYGQSEDEVVHQLEDAISHRNDIAAISSGTIVQWVLESHDVARDVVYRYLPNAPEIGSDYADVVRPVVYDRLLRGGRAARRSTRTRAGALSVARWMLGLVGFVGVGLALGLLGGGGSILAVPVLVHLLGVPAGTAVPMALPVVGVAAAAGAFTRWRSGQLRLHTVALFAACAMGASYIAARLGTTIPDRPRLLLFGVTMFIAAAAMWRRASRGSTAGIAAPRPAMQVIPVAIVVGTLTGILGVGGGFLIVPALTGVLALPMPEATATSLAVIALNTAAAGAGFFSRHVSIDVRLTAVVTVAALAGMALGLRLAPRFSAPTLARAFAVLLVVLAGFTIGKELLA